MPHLLAIVPSQNRNHSTSAGPAFLSPFPYRTQILTRLPWAVCARSFPLTHIRSACSYLCHRHISAGKLDGS
ncbi:hypothetical protein CGRA01v4_07182 [Colletotrichum graminicola]|nr:hypothetical protein CGRA01v4_07182 [Colletotrichum graminicola]